MCNGVIKRTAAVIAVIQLLLAMTSCIGREYKNELINKMTEAEKERSSKTELQILDEPWNEYTNDFAGIVYYIEGFGALVYGSPCFDPLPPEGYDGGAGSVIYRHLIQDKDPEEIVFEDYEDFKEQLSELIEEDIKAGYPRVPAEEHFDDIIGLYDAYIAGETQDIDRDDLEAYLEQYWAGEVDTGSDGMYWEMDKEKVEAIRDSITEYHIYDEELDLGFVVHVTTPPVYDADTVYPALVMTDAVWRFKDVTEIYQAMEEGRAEPQILITIGFEYDIDGWDNEVRSNILCDHKKEFLDFITDNLMPYLSEVYRFDTDSSPLFGHSQGGVFAHYAAFNYDRYENKPFKNYIIGSPTFWTPYFTDVSDYKDYKDEYGYFDRNDTYDRNILITAGDKEDEDYEDYYGDNDSTLEGVEHLTERLNTYGVTTFEVKIYDSHHYQYVSDMLIEYVCDKV